MTNHELQKFKKRHYVNYCQVRVYLGEKEILPMLKSFIEKP